jgi:hypothetical protein
MVAVIIRKILSRKLSIIRLITYYSKIAYLFFSRRKTSRALSVYFKRVRLFYDNVIRLLLIYILLLIFSALKKRALRVILSLA